METTVAESTNWASNLGPYNYQADALATCYCLLLLLVSVPGANLAMMDK